jgi:hypothetical protein
MDIQSDLRLERPIALSAIMMAAGIYIVLKGRGVNDLKRLQDRVVTHIPERVFVSETTLTGNTTRVDGGGIQVVLQLLLAEEVFVAQGAINILDTRRTRRRIRAFHGGHFV